MIDLKLTQERMLRDIGASEGTLKRRVSGPVDPQFVKQSEAFLVVEGSTRDELLSPLEAAFSRRFSRVAPPQLKTQLFSPLRRALGNAFKHGNRKDVTKRISVEAIVTDNGVVLKVSDDGDGFDVERTLERFRSGQGYFENRGAGFLTFERTESRISYANGGRSVLIRFLCGPEAQDVSSLGRAGDREFMKSYLTALPKIRKHGFPVESCWIRGSAKRGDGTTDITYFFEHRKRKRGIEYLTPKTWTGRLLPEHRARRDYSIASQLYRGSIQQRGGLRVPKPMAAFDRHPGLVLYRFAPVMDLREYLLEVSDPRDRDRAIRIVARGLRALHESKIPLHSVEDSELNHEYEFNKDLTRKLTKAGMARLAEQIPSLDEFDPVPVHGSFGLDCVLYGDGGFFIYRFDRCGLSHPGFDLGAFLVDLQLVDLQRSVGNGRTAGESFEEVRDRFLENYFSVDAPAWRDHLPFFVEVASVQRCQPLEECEQERTCLPRRLR